MRDDIGGIAQALPTRNARLPEPGEIRAERRLSTGRLRPRPHDPAFGHSPARRLLKSGKTAPPTLNAARAGQASDEWSVTWCGVKIRLEPDNMQFGPRAKFRSPSPRPSSKIRLRTPPREDHHRSTEACEDPAKRISRHCRNAACAPTSRSIGKTWTQGKFGAKARNSFSNGKSFVVDRPGEIEC